MITSTTGILDEAQSSEREEFGHAQQFPTRIKELRGVVPASEAFTATRDHLEPPAHQTDIVHVIRGVIAAESGAIAHCERIIEASDTTDPVTQDMAIAILRDEQKHRCLVEGFLREHEAEGKA